MSHYRELRPLHIGISLGAPTSFAGWPLHRVHLDYSSYNDPTNIGRYSPWQARSVITINSEENTGDKNQSKFWARLLASSGFDELIREVDASAAMAVLKSTQDEADNQYSAAQDELHTREKIVLPPSTDQECALEILMADWASVLASQTQWKSSGLPHIPDTPSIDDLSALLPSARRSITGQKENGIRVQTAYRICRELREIFETAFSDLTVRIKDRDPVVHQLLIETALHRAGLPGTCRKITTADTLELLILWPETHQLVHPMIAEIEGKQTRLSRRDPGSIPNTITRLLVRYLVTAANIASAFHPTYENIIVRAASEPEFEHGNVVYLAELEIPVAVLQRCSYTGPDWKPNWTEITNRYQKTFTIEPKKLASFAQQFGDQLEHADSQLMKAVGPSVTIGGFDAAANLTPLTNAKPSPKRAAVLTYSPRHVPGAFTPLSSINYWIDLKDRDYKQREKARQPAATGQSPPRPSQRPRLHVK